MLRISQMTLILSASAVLIACGGGSSTAPTVGTSGGPVLSTAAYGGAWKDISVGTACGLSSVQQTNATGANLRENAFVTLTPLTDTTISVTLGVKHYAPSDASCAGAVLVTETLTPYVLQIDGTATIAGQVVDKITFPAWSLSNDSLVIGSTAIANSTLGTSAATINGYYFHSGYFSPQTNPTHKGYLRATATNLYCDNETGTATAYPTGMDTAACFVKI